MQNPRWQNGAPIRIEKHTSRFIDHNGRDRFSEEGLEQEIDQCKSKCNRGNQAHWDALQGPLGRLNSSVKIHCGFALHNRRRGVPL